MFSERPTKGINSCELVGDIIRLREECLAKDLRKKSIVAS